MGNSGSRAEELAQDGDTKKMLREHLLNRPINISIFDHTPCTTAHVYCLTTIIAMQPRQKQKSSQEEVNALTISQWIGHACFDLVPTKVNQSVKSVRKELDEYQRPDYEATLKRGQEPYKLLSSIGGKKTAWFSSGDHMSLAKLPSGEGRVGRAPSWVMNYHKLKTCECFPLKCKGVWVLPDGPQGEGEGESKCQPQYLVLEVEFLGTCSAGVEPRILALWAFYNSKPWNQLPKELIVHIASFLPLNKPDPSMHSCGNVAKHWKENNEGNQSVFISLAYMGQQIEVKTKGLDQSYFWE